MAAKKREPMLITDVKSDKEFAYITLRVTMELFFNASTKADRIKILKDVIKLEKKI